MQRKHFLSSLIPLTAALSSMKSGDELHLELGRKKSSKIPPYLRVGDTIGITCPAGFISADAIKPAIQLIESWGFKTQIGKTVGKQDFTFGGTDQERTEDLQYMLDAPHIKAIMCARGGYGVVRIVDNLNFKGFKRHPKWIIGFSDITVLHNHIHQNYHWASLHSKMCNSFPTDWGKAEPIQIQTITSIKQALTGNSMSYTAPPSAANRTGTASGQLIGGNLSLVASMTGTRSDIDTRGKILFLEDTGEYIYNIDRMLYNLLRSGKLNHLAGLIIGGFKLKPDEPGEEFGKNLQTVVNEKIGQFNYPVCFNFPVGHQKNNFALKCGILHTLAVTETGSLLQSEE
ncbi:LD-carboxypeptidase [Mucilaginibacter terrae]|uniref:S66 peptidase family protein n=1 Tax=Mucilaginibacter terrae TaxID=1955052 RepID=UPI00363DD60E